MSHELGDPLLARDHGAAVADAGGARQVAPPAQSRWNRLRSVGPLGGLVVACIVFSVLNPKFATVQNASAIVEAGAVLMVVAVGLTFVILLGSIDLSVEGLMAAAVMAISLLVANDQNTIHLGVLGVVLAVGAGTVLGTLNGLLHTVLRLPSFMVTLGTWYVGLGIATVVIGGVTPTIRDPALLDWGVHRWLGMSQLSLVAVGCVLVGYLIQRFTRLGRYAFAIGGNEHIARLSGIPVARYRVGIFALAGTFYGLAGVMLATSLRSGSLTASNDFLFSGVAAVVIGGTALTGGRGGVLHSVVGVLLITVINVGMVLAGVSPLIQTAVQGVIIVGVVVAAGWSHRHRMKVVK
jgi:ribose transport system permease protein